MVTSLNDEDSSYSNIDFNGYKLIYKWKSHQQIIFHTIVRNILFFRISSYNKNSAKKEMAEN